MANDLHKIFREEMRQLNKNVSPETFIEVLKAKLIDYIGKNPSVESAELKRAVKEIFDPQYYQWMRDVNKGFNTAIDIVNNVYSDLAGDMRRDMAKLERLEKISKIKLGKYSDEAKKFIHKAVNKSITEKRTYKETVTAIKEVGDKAAFYAGTIATTQLRGYARGAKNEKANIAEVFYYEYVGPMRNMSRPFCKDMVGRTLHIDEIKVLGRSEIGSAFINPCIIYCGGWNCGHDWEPDPFYN